MGKRAYIAIVFAMMLAGCAGNPARHDDYAAFGGKDGISAIVEEVLVRSASDPRIAHHFANANLVHLHEKLTEQICVEVGGPCSYTGFPMAQAHDGRHINEADFNVLVEHLIDVMQAQGVPRTAQNRLLRRLAAMHADVVYR